MLIERRSTENESRDFTTTPEHWAAALRYYEDHKNELIQAASFSRKKSVSHRVPPFQVGCAAMGIEPNLPAGEYAIYQAHNFTPTPGTRKGQEKRCAERNALEAAEVRARLIVSITTVSKEIHTGDPTQAHDALHPCKECRLMFRDLLNKGLLREDTIICSANDSDEKIATEERTLGQLLDLYPDDLEKQSE